MSVSYKDIKNSRQWSAAIGMKEQKFFELVPSFKFAYKDIYGIEMFERQNNSSHEARFKTYEDLLFFLLFSLKSGLTYDALGLVFGITGSAAKNIQTIGLKILKVTLKNISMSPEREFKNLEIFKKIIPADEPIIIDGNEQRVQRSVDQDVRKLNYSGKKKTSQ